MGMTGEPDREQLLRAVEGGSPEELGELLDAGPGPSTAPELREELLATARGWYEEGPEARLRRLTGAVGPARTRQVMEGPFHHATEITLGGRTVRDGHGGILTLLEWTFRILTPVEELVARAVRHGDPEHCDWGRSALIFDLRQSPETWAQKVAFHRHPDPLRRLFVAEVLGAEAFNYSFVQHARWYERERLKVLAAWVEVEDDGGVLAELLRVIGNEDFPGARALGLRQAGHADPRVRRRVPPLFGRPLDPDTARTVRELAGDTDAGVRAEAAQALGEEPLSPEDREVLITLLRDEDPQVLARAVYTAGHTGDRTPAVTEALIELLDSDEQETRLAVAFALACRNDPHTREAYARVGPLGPELAGDHRVDGLWRWKTRNATQEGTE
ncbi:HEAT repeat domain-containing protein [Streptomyces sp. NPDC002467]|uniref:HEAT repeat domain-containing protein n=1 Tax=Streptomyces sp. NPDC002467 TaxID=3364647 RepID=UPI0036B801BD